MARPKSPFGAISYTSVTLQQAYVCCSVYKEQPQVEREHLLRMPQAEPNIMMIMSADADVETVL